MLISYGHQQRGSIDILPLKNFRRNKMTKAQARKKRTVARKTLNHWRSEYVKIVRDTDPSLDAYSWIWHGTQRDHMIKRCINEMNESKSRIADAERFAY